MTLTSTAFNLVTSDALTLKTGILIHSLYSLLLFLRYFSHCLEARRDSVKVILQMALSEEVMASLLSMKLAEKALDILNSLLLARNWEEPKLLRDLRSFLQCEEGSYPIEVCVLLSYLLLISFSHFIRKW
jgi:hypothetical protein